MIVEAVSVRPFRHARRSVGPLWVGAVSVIQINVMGPFRLVFNIIFVDVTSNHKNMMCDINGAVSVLYYNVIFVDVI